MINRFKFKLIHLTLVFAVLILTIDGCGPTIEELKEIEYQPVTLDDWEVSTPQKQGLDPLLVARMYYHASRLKSIHSLLVIKNGFLVAEDYFNEGAISTKDNLKSVTKSYTSALVGIAVEKGIIKSVDQKMIDFFPELVEGIKDLKKKDITVKQMLQMRAGYPWEESTAELFKLLYYGFRASNLVEVPLNKDPGSGMEYSNLTSHALGIIVARASGTDLKSFAEANLFTPLGVEVGEWVGDWEGNYLGHADLYFTPRDIAHFGLLYLNNGKANGKQIIPSEWISNSLETYSKNAWPHSIGSNVNDMGYGYQWWSVRAGEHYYNLAWGHGGQQIAVLQEQNIMIVLTANSLHGKHGGESWDMEKANLNVVADFIASLPVREE